MSPSSGRVRARRIGRLPVWAWGVLLLIHPLLLVLGAAELEEGFERIFNDRTLDGWKGHDMSYWTVEEGAITGRITREHPCGTNQYLIWQGGELADFELKLKSRVNGDGSINNGFQFRSRRLPDGDVAGYQVDNNLNTDWRVRLYDEFGRHTLAWRGERTIFDEQGRPATTPIPEATGAAPFRLEEWHEYHLICQGSRLTLKVNDRLVAEVIDHDPRRRDAQGILGLQLHSGPPTVAQFKDIRLKILKPAAPAQDTPNQSRESARQALLGQAEAHWDLGVGGHGAGRSLQQVGDSELNVRADGAGSRPGARGAVLREAHFDAGKALNLRGRQMTVFLRMRDPGGRWDSSLVTKGAGGSEVHFRLVGDAGRLRFEVGTESGLGAVHFSSEGIDPTAWHDLAGRYNGQRLELICDGQVMAAQAWQGGDLLPNGEPLLIGAESREGKVLRRFTGEMEESALWSRALTDAELRLLMRQEISNPDANQPAQ